MAMRTIHIDDYKSTGPCVVCVGNFDGVHRGHQSLMRQAVQSAGADTPTVYTFSRHPANVLAGRPVNPLITTNQERLAILEELGIAQTVLDPFRPELYNMAPETFFEEILIGRLHATAIVCGTRYHFGRDGAGDVRLLEQCCDHSGIVLHLMPPVRQGDRIISSSWVRSAIAEGDVQTAAQLLGRPYRLTAEVLQGDHRGRTLGTPTANQAFPELKLRPRKGVYITRLTIDGAVYYGTTAVSARPTFHGGSGGDNILAETHVLHYEGDLYGRTLQVDFLQRTRDIVTFSSAAQLRDRLCHDVAEADALRAEELGVPSLRTEVER